MTMRDAIDASAEALRARQMAGKITRPWADLPNSDKRKWLDHVACVLQAALDHDAHIAALTAQVERLETENGALREALEQCAAALQMFPSCEREIIKFTGKWKRYGSMRIADILDRANAALTSTPQEGGGE